MLIGFSVSNYKSFLEQQSISLLASRISRHKNHVVGANAGGKSNFIRAVSFSRNIILFGLNGTDTSKKYFRIKQNANKIPGVFEYRLIANNTEYSYGFAFSYITKEFLSEWLVKISNDTETVLYDRSIDENGNSIISSDVVDNDDESTLRLKLYLEDFGNGISDTLKKKTILSDIAQRSSIQSGVIKEIIDVYKWFQDLIVIFPQSKYANLGSIVEDHDSKDSFSNYLLNFDTGIESIESQLMEFDLDKLLSDIPKEKADQIENEIANRVTYSPVTLKINDQRFVLKQNENGEIVYSKMLLNHGNADDLFEYSDESDGTQRLFDLIPIFFALKQNRVILIDEIDRSLHTNLTRKFIELFFSVSRNNSSQLIATTHDSNLLDLDLLRQDEIWFVKREKDHSSNIYSLNLYKERFDKRIEKEYLVGRYGATPNLEKLDAFEEVIDDE